MLFGGFFIDKQKTSGLLEAGQSTSGACGGGRLRRRRRRGTSDFLGRALGASPDRTANDLGEGGIAVFFLKKALGLLFFCFLCFCFGWWL